MENTSPLHLTNRHVEIIVLALELLYAKRLSKDKRLRAKGHIAQKDTAEIQETLQFLTLARNLRTNKVDPDLLASAKMVKDDETTSNSGLSTLAGAEGEEKSST